MWESNPENPHATLRQEMLAFQVMMHLVRLLTHSNFG